MEIANTAAVSKKINKELLVVAVVAIIAFAVFSYFIFLNPAKPNILVDKIVYQDQKYYFSSDIYDTEKNVTLSNSADILLLLSKGRLQIVFNGSSVKDFPYFTTTGYNIVFKMQQYSVYTQGKVLNVTTEVLENATFDKPTILLRGPNSGATRTSISLLESNVILVQGLSEKELEMAGDRLVMLFLGINLKNPNFTVLV